MKYSLRRKISVYYSNNILLIINSIMHMPYFLLLPWLLLSIKPEILEGWGWGDPISGCPSHMKPWHWIVLYQSYFLATGFSPSSRSSSTHLFLSDVCSLSEWHGWPTLYTALLWGALSMRGLRQIFWLWFLHKVHLLRCLWGSWVEWGLLCLGFRWGLLPWCLRFSWSLLPWCLRFTWSLLPWDWTLHTSCPITNRRHLFKIV